MIKRYEKTMKRLTYTLLAAVLLTLTSCGEDRTGEFYALIEDRMWIEETMLANYLWADEITPVEDEDDYFQEPATFFKNLLSKTALDGRGDKYSYMEEDPKSDNGEESRSTTLDRTSTYGMEFLLTNDPTGTTNHTFARVLYTLEGSPAQQAGIRRGDWITSIDGQRITTSNYRLLMQGAAAKLSRSRLTSTEEGTLAQTVDTLTLGASVPMEINPFYTCRTIETEGQKIAYLVYNEFATGPENKGTETTYDEQMKQIFAAIKAQQPDAFILDLRYNNGGFLQCAQALASLLAPAHALGKDFATLTFNGIGSNTNQHYPLDSRYADANLNLSRIYILTGELTASASEAVINGLIPYMGVENVILIGTQTEGKNVAMQSFRNDTYGFTLWPVVAYVSNAEGNSDYADGFKPTFPLNEQQLIDWLPLGDPEEYLLKNTLALITTGTMPDLQENESRSLTVKPLVQKTARPMIHVPACHPDDRRETPASINQ